MRFPFGRQKSHNKACSYKEKKKVRKEKHTGKLIKKSPNVKDS